MFFHKGNYDNTPDSYKWVFGDSATDPGNTIESNMIESASAAGCPHTIGNWFYNKGNYHSTEWVPEDVDISCIDTLNKEGRKDVVRQLVTNLPHIRLL